MTEFPMRPKCDRCNGWLLPDFKVPNHIWRAAVANPDDALCLRCFDEVATKHGVAWEVEGVSFFPVSGQTWLEENWQQPGLTDGDQRVLVKACRYAKRWPVHNGGPGEALLDDLIAKLEPLELPRPCQVGPGCHNAEPGKPCCIERGLEPL